MLHAPEDNRKQVAYFRLWLGAISVNQALGWLWATFEKSDLIENLLKQSKCSPFRRAIVPSAT